MKSTIIHLCIAALTLTLFAACGDDGGGGSSSSGSSSSECDSSFDCIGGSCQCTTTGKQGTACCDPDDCGNDVDACNNKCEVCD